jgi:hypothetical protein
MNPRLSHKARWGAALVLLAVVAILLLEFRRGSMPLRIISSSPTLHIAFMACTVGTNHIFYYGRVWDRAGDAFERWRRKRNHIAETPFEGQKLYSVSQEKSTVIWVSLVHPDFGIVPPGQIITTPGGDSVFRPRGEPMPFQAQLKDTNGVVTWLTGADSCSHSYKERAWITGWKVPGALQSGSTIRIELTNGDEAVTFRVR